MRLDDRELATVLAALRAYGDYLRGEPPSRFLQDIAADDGRLAPLSPEEIDGLGEKLNTAPEKETEKLLHEQRLVLQDLVGTINATGGVMRDDKGQTVPVADEDWLDLGDLYLAACRLLNREPLFEADALPPTDTCTRCGAALEAGFCSDETCPFSDHRQTCRVGWSGHPERDPFPRDDGIGPCAQCTCEYRCADCGNVDSATDMISEEGVIGLLCPRCGSGPVDVIREETEQGAGEGEEDSDAE